MSEMDIRQYKTSVEEFLGLKELYPQGKYTICSGEGPRSTWFSFVIPINNVDLEVTWFLEAHKLSVSVWTEMAEELELI